MKEYYTTKGSVRGECGHKHKTPEAAIACCDKDRRGCAEQNGYSDREVHVVVDGVYERYDDFDPCDACDGTRTCEQCCVEYERAVK